MFLVFESTFVEIKFIDKLKFSDILYAFNRQRKICDADILIKKRIFCWIIF